MFINDAVYLLYVVVVLFNPLVAQQGTVVIQLLTEHKLQSL